MTRNMHSSDVSTGTGDVPRVNLSANESPLEPSPRVLEAITAYLRTLNRYPDKDGVNLKQVIAKKLRVQPENVILGNGSSEILDLAARTFLLAGEEAVMGFPAFFPYQSVVEKAHGSKVIVPLKDYRFDLDLMAQKITAKTRLIIIANPNNPTGTIINRDELDHFLAKIPDEVITVIDEAYYEYVQQKLFPVALDYVHQEKRVLVLRTLSKAYGLAGLRIGYGIGPATIIQQLNDTCQHYNTNHLAQIAAAVALEDPEYLQKSVRLNAEGMQYLRGQLERMQIEYVPSEANFLLVRVGDGRAVTRELMNRGILVQAMDRYQLPEYIRVTVGLAEENEKFVSALRTISID
ncbi:MAG: histidinol-phosphate transaminase [Gammaproteobacteria bacterium]